MQEKEKNRYGNVEIRPMQPQEYALLPVFLYHAIYVPEGVAPPQQDVVQLPPLRVYTQDFGTRRGDCCMVAAAEGYVVGAVWCRIMDDYGHLDDDTPSLAVALLPGYTAMGIGTRLMRALFVQVRQMGYARVSLSVQKSNPAVRFYRRLGFYTVWETEEEYGMIRTL